MLAEGNIPQLGKRTQIYVRFYTTKAGEFAIRKSPQFQMLEKHADCSFNLIVEKILGKHQSLSCMNVCQRDALNRGFEKKRLLLPFTGDVVITENLLSEAWDHIKDGYRLIVGAGLRLNKLAILEKAKVKKGVNWHLTNKEAIEFAIRERHIYSKRQTLGAPRFHYMAELYCETKRILGSRCFALAPFALFPKELLALPKITFDDNFIDALFPSPDEIKILDEVAKDGAIFSLTDEKEYIKTNTILGPINPRTYANIIYDLLHKGNLGKTHVFYFKRIILYGSKKDPQASLVKAKLKLAGDTILDYLEIKQTIFKSSPNFSLQNIKNHIKSLVLKSCYNYFPDLLHILNKKQKRYYGFSFEKKKLFKELIIIYNALVQPFCNETKFICSIILRPWEIGYTVKKATDPRCVHKPFAITASLFKKIRAIAWPFFMILIFQIGSTFSPFKILVLKMFGCRCAWKVKIHRGVYFKNPWNIIIRKNTEINSDVLFDTPSEIISIGMGTKIGARCYLASVRSTPYFWNADAVNESISVAALSRIQEGTIIIPKLR